MRHPSFLPCGYLEIQVFGLQRKIRKVKKNREIGKTNWNEFFRRDKRCASKWKLFRVAKGSEGNCAGASPGAPCKRRRVARGGGPRKWKIRALRQGNPPPFPPPFSSIPPKRKMSKNPPSLSPAANIAAAKKREGCFLPLSFFFGVRLPLAVRRNTAALLFSHLKEWLWVFQHFWQKIIERGGKRLLCHSVGFSKTCGTERSELSWSSFV